MLPLGDEWYQHLIDQQHDTDTHRRAPRLLSDDPTERSLAGFAAKQRLAYRRGRLAPRRIAMLERLDFWTWGSKPPRSLPWSAGTGMGPTTKDGPITPGTVMFGPRARDETRADGKSTCATAASFLLPRSGAVH